MDEKKIKEVSEAMDRAMEDWKGGSVSSHLDESFDWRKPMKEMMSEGDVAGMAEVVAPKLQAEMIELALSSQTPPATKYTALANLLAQAGYAPTQKATLTVDYNTMDTDQLNAVLKSKLQNLSQLIPGFDAKKLIPSDIVDGELVEEIGDLDG